MIISLKEVVVDFLNRLPSKDVVSNTLSSSTILEEEKNEEMWKKKVTVGSYFLVLVYTTNRTKSRCVPDIAIKRLNNFGGYNFMNIYITKQIHR